MQMEMAEKVCGFSIFILVDQVKSTDRRYQGDASQDTANQQSQATMKVEEDMELTLERLNLQGAAPQDTSDQPTALLDYEIAEAETQWERKIREASLIKPGIQPQEYHSQMCA